MKHLTTEILTRQRSEEEKLRRHLYGDKGASFSGGKVPKIDRGGGDRNDNHDGDEGSFTDRDL